MTDSSITVRRAEREDIARVEALLEANDLPHRDVRTKLECFFVASSDAEVIGVGGVEIYGSNGLLRSIVIEESSRGRGHGMAVRETLEKYARTGNDAVLVDYDRISVLPPIRIRRGRSGERPREHPADDGVYGPLSDLGDLSEEGTPRDDRSVRFVYPSVREPRRRARRWLRR